MKDGVVPADGPDHFFLDFDVPAGTKEIEIRHDDKSAANILDWGVNDQDGYRGWGGGTSEPVVIGETAASRAYVPGPIKPGTWRVIVGKAKVVASPALYHVEIDLRTAPTLAPVPRKPYQVAAPRKAELRYYAGDFHVHSRESTDARPTLEENVALAKQRGLDFIEMSDHNTITQLDFFEDIQSKEPAFLLIPGIEFTTYMGHANAIGATKWVDHKIGQPGVTIEGAADQILAQGAILSINHPALDIGDLCIGCAWKHQLDPKKIGGVEIGTGGLSKGAALFSAKAIAFWDALLDKGIKIPAMGGSDDHRAGVSDGNVESPIGSPTTLIRARELSVAGITEGIRKGATVVKLEGPSDPMCELEAATSKGGGEAIAFPGDSIGVRKIVLRAEDQRAHARRLASGPSREERRARGRPRRRDERSVRLRDNCRCARAGRGSLARGGAPRGRAPHGDEPRLAEARRERPARARTPPAMTAVAARSSRASRALRARARRPSRRSGSGSRRLAFVRARRRR